MTEKNDNGKLNLAVAATNSMIAALQADEMEITANFVNLSDDQIDNIKNAALFLYQISFLELWERHKKHLRIKGK